MFLYANYDNPVSEGDTPGEKPKYLVVGCGFLKKKWNTMRFEKPESVFEGLTKRPGMQNFPRINWALQYTLDYPRSDQYEAAWTQGC